MDNGRIKAVVEDLQTVTESFRHGVDIDTSRLRQSLRESCKPLQESISLNIASCEVRLSRAIALICQDTEYHILNAYYRASPGLIAFLVGAVKFVLKVVGIIKTINEILVVITHETLSYWIGRLIPGFEEAWRNMMNGISEFSAALGWGVDGVLHLMNVIDTSASLAGMVTGKTESWVDGEKWRRKQVMLKSYHDSLALWQSNPGQQIGTWADVWSRDHYSDAAWAMSGLVEKVGVFGDKAEEALIGLGSITSELLAIQNDMPVFIAKNLPQGLWDSLTAVDTVINDRILPALTDITDRIDELDAVLEAHRKKAEEMADKIAHPGDLLAEIDKLPDYARIEQLGKIDEVTSRLMAQANEAEFAALEGDLREFSLIAEALSHPPPALAFMQLELPGRAPGITAEPRETWMVGDF